MSTSNFFIFFKRKEGRVLGCLVGDTALKLPCPCFVARSYGVVERETGGPS